MYQGDFSFLESPYGFRFFDKFDRNMTLLNYGLLYDMVSYEDLKKVDNDIFKYSSKALLDSLCIPYFFEDYRYELIPVNTKDSFLKFFSDDVPLDDSSDSFMLADTDLSTGQKRLSDTDVHLILPTLFSVRLLVNAIDVLHAFVILSTGVKIDAVVGRLNEVTVYLLRSGIFYGACSELCGSGHFGMPIVVESLPFNLFDGYGEDKF
jgi:heme/copper-type cytochrome/quinol oxidase subunit 2